MTCPYCIYLFTLNAFVMVMPFFPILFHRSKSVVKTGGALLDELQENGMDALKYKVILFLMKCMNDL